MNPCVYVFSAGNRMKRYVRDDAMAMCQIVARTLKEGNEGHYDAPGR